MHVLDRLSVAKKLTLFLVFSLAMAFGLCLGAAWILGSTLRAVAAHSLQGEKAVQAADHVRLVQVNFKTQVQEFKNILLRGHVEEDRAKYRASFEAEEQQVRQGLETLEGELSALGLDAAPVARTLQAHRELGEAYRQGLQKLDGAGDLGYRDVDRQLRGVDRNMIDSLDALAASIQAFNGQRQNQALDQLHALRRKGLLSLSVLLVLGGGACVLLVQRISRGIRTSLAAVEGAAAKLAQGDLRERIPASGSDELARVSRSMNHTMETLAGLLGDLRTGSERLAASSMQLSSTSQEMNRATGEIAQSTEAQREATEQTAAAMVELAASTEHIAGLVNATGERSRHMVRLTEEGAAQGQAAAHAMEEIREASGKMVQAVRVIQDLARQTNLLSLNAAIEAAKAGAMGKGFAVVAEEVRKLAERSAAAAKEIGLLIAVAEEAMQRGMGIIGSTVDSLRSVAQGVQEVASANHQIGTATGEQSTTAAEVARQIEKNAADMERSAAATTELSRTVEEIHRTSDHLARTAEDLAAAMRIFQTQ